MSGKSASDYAEQYTKPELRERLKEEIKASSKGGRKGEWSARKSQLLAQRYEQEGGDYKQKGKKSKGQKSLEKWTREEWQTADGKAEARHGETTERYLPKKAWALLSDAEKRKTDEKKRRGSRAGKQFIANSKEAKAARAFVDHGDASGLTASQLAKLPKKDLDEHARKTGLAGRSKMTKAALAKAIAKG